MKPVGLILLFFFILPRGSIAEIRFSENAKLYLLTTSQGKSIDQSWGHSAVWFVDSLNNIDFVFEYTSTERSNYISTIKLLFGKDIYQLRATNLEKYEAEILDRNQMVSYQLVSGDKNEIEPVYFDLVAELKQKAKHRYSLSSKNCSTLIYDHIQTLCKKDFEVPNKSIRDIFRSDGKLTFWQELFIIDILPSSIADQKLSKPSPITPNYLERLFHNRPNHEASTPLPFKNIFKILVCLFLVVLLATYKPQVYLKVFFLCAGLFGTVLALTCSFTDEPLFKHNHQLLWLNPIHWVGLFLSPNGRNTYIRIATIFLLAAIIISLVNGHLSMPFFVLSGSALVGNGTIIIINNVIAKKHYL